MFNRAFNIDNNLKRKSFFVFGPRQTGKSTYLDAHYSDALLIDLLKAADYRELLTNPENLEKRIAYVLGEAGGRKNSPFPLVIVDEVQKVPALLDEVHRLIEKNKSLRFILTGSSPRKLKRAQANLLGGRAGILNVHPITCHELKTDKKCKKTWKDMLCLGSLPAVLNSENPFDDLEDYIATYLKEEIEEEGLSRSLSGFSRFLNFSALRIGEQLNFTSLGSDAQLSPVTVAAYFQILHDTLIGHLVEPFNQTRKRKAMMSAKFYFFDLGIVNALVKRRGIAEFSAEWGALLENLIHNEIQAYLDYNGIRKKIQFWRSTSKLEVDFVVWDEANANDLAAIEVKATVNPVRKHCNGLNALSEEFKGIKKFIVCNSAAPMKLENDVVALPVDAFIEKLWSGEMIRRTG